MDKHELIRVLNLFKFKIHPLRKRFQSEARINEPLEKNVADRLKFYRSIDRQYDEVFQDLFVLIYNLKAAIEIGLRQGREMELTIRLVNGLPGPDYGSFSGLQGDAKLVNSLVRMDYEAEVELFEAAAVEIGQLLHVDPKKSRVSRRYVPPCCPKCRGRQTTKPRDDYRINTCTVCGEKTNLPR